ncbi:hypothetical protein F4818DRAFT_423760 [Hypoxylon cercidicola]|nr:hypothetical protein F4818DRAFT_423760 [Hypoxylon cercidicola]
MSSSLHELLQTRTFCNTNSHSDHSVKLILNTSGEESPHVNLFFEKVIENDSIGRRHIRPIYAPLYACCKNAAYPRDLNPDSSSGIEKKQKRGDTHLSQQTQPIRLLTSWINRLQTQDEEDLTEARVQCEKFISNQYAASPGVVGELESLLGIMEIHMGELATGQRQRK